MPSRRQPQTLYSLCLTILLEILKKRQWHDPLVNLPSVIIEDIMEAAFLASYWFGDIDWKIFFVPQVKHIILFEEMTDLCKSLASCKQLRKITLVISPNKHLSLKKIQMYLKYSSVVRTVRSVDDYVVNNVHLQSNPLVVRNISSVSWIWSLQGGRPSFLSHGPVELYLPYVDVSIEDIMCILQECPSISVLRHNHLVAALYLLHVDDASSDNLPQYRLQNLDMEFQSATSSLMTKSIAGDAVMLATKMCSKASVIKVVSGNVTPKGLFQQFLLLENVEELSTCGEFLNSDLSTEIQMFLEVKGRNMKRLELSCLMDLDMLEIVAQCPYLEHLNLEMNAYFGLHSKLFPVQLPELEHLKVLSINRCADVPQSFWKPVLSSRQLTRICLLNVRIDPTFLLQIINENRWNNLSFLSFFCCLDVSIAHIKALLNANNKLCFLAVNKFGNMKENVINKIHEHIEQHGFDVKFRCI